VPSLPAGALQVPALLSCCTRLEQLRLLGAAGMGEALLPAQAADALLRLRLRSLHLMRVALAQQAVVKPTATTSSSSSSSSSSTITITSSSSSSSRDPLAVLPGLQELHVVSGSGFRRPHVLAPSLLPCLRQLTKLSWGLAGGDLHQTCWVS